MTTCLRMQGPSPTAEGWVPWQCAISHSFFIAISPSLPLSRFGNSQKGGAKRIVRFWGGGNVLQSPPPIVPVLEASEKGIRLVCALFLLQRKWQGVKKGGGEAYLRWGGGPKPFWGGVFMVCFPLPWVSPPCFLWKMSILLSTSFESFSLSFGSSQTWLFKTCPDLPFLGVLIFFVLLQPRKFLGASSVFSKSSRVFGVFTEVERGKILGVLGVFP